MEREQSLAREQVQLGLDWQRRCEDTEREQIRRSEALIEGLTASRAQVGTVQPAGEQCHPHLLATAGEATAHQPHPLAVGRLCSQLAGALFPCAA